MVFMMSFPCGVLRSARMTFHCNKQLGIAAVSSDHTTAHDDDHLLPSPLLPQEQKNAINHRFFQQLSMHQSVNLHLISNHFLGAACSIVPINTIASHLHVLVQQMHQSSAPRQSQPMLSLYQMANNNESHCSKATNSNAGVLQFCVCYRCFQGKNLVLYSCKKNERYLKILDLRLVIENVLHPLVVEDSLFSFN